MIPFKFKSDIWHLLVSTWNERSKLISNIYGTIANEMGSHPRLHKLFSSNSSWILMVQISQISLFRSKLRIFCWSKKTLHGNLMIGGSLACWSLDPSDLRKFMEILFIPKWWNFPGAESRECGKLNWIHQWMVDSLKSCKIYCSFLAHFQPESHDSYCWDRMISILGFPWYLVNGAGCKSRK